MVIRNKKAQVTIYVIVAIVIVVAGVIIFSLRGNFSKNSVPSFVEPIENSFLTCIQDEAQTGISIIESKGGYLENPKFVAGSVYQPFSSELDFGGEGIPYWFYLKSSNLESVQVPTKADMESSLENYLEGAILNCNFREYTNQGYGISLGEPKVNVAISDNYVDVEVKRDLTVSKDYESSVVQDHSVRINSNLGNLYDAAVQVYEKEENDFFLENYSVDNLRLYLPTDGFELSCSPLSWNAPDLYNTYSDMLEVNTILLNNKGKKEDYYDVDFSGGVDLRFVYSKDWPTYFQVNPSNGNKLIAKPIGKTGDLGVLGFCYVPYHFVYNIRHPVLIQVTKDDETFQFPVVVIVEGNVARESRSTESISGTEQSQICENMNLGFAKVDVYDTDLNPLNANLSFSCFDSTCDLGTTSNGEYSGSIPQCVNGVLETSAEGYKDEKITYTTVQNSSILVVMEKEYKKDISLVVDGRKYSGKAMITFNSGDTSKTVFYPSQDSVNLSTGSWNVEVYLLANTSIDFPESTQEQCYDVPKSGPLGAVGLTKKECTNITIPQQIISEAIVGGDTANVTFSLNQLENSNTLEISDLSERIPTTIEELQVNYALLDSGVMDVMLK